MLSTSFTFHFIILLLIIREYTLLEVKSLCFISQLELPNFITIHHKMITNINYKGFLAPGEVVKINFNEAMKPPVQHVEKTDCGATMIIFKSGKFRLMGVTTCVLDFIDQLPFKIANFEMQSASVAINFGCVINLRDLHKRLTSLKCLYEPELFPAARLLKYNPMCVNVFQSGKVTIVGVRDINFVQDLIFDIQTYIFSALH